MHTHTHTVVLPKVVSTGTCDTELRLPLPQCSAGVGSRVQVQTLPPLALISSWRSHWPWISVLLGQASPV